jgi:hypothetical protein
MKARPSFWKNAVKLKVGKIQEQVTRNKECMSHQHIKQEQVSLFRLTSDKRVSVPCMQIRFLKIFFVL